QGPGRFRRERRRRARIARKLAGAGGGEGGKTARPLSRQCRKTEALRGLEEEALMFFILSKTVGFVLLPSNFLLLLALAGTVLLATRWRRAGLRMVIGAAVLLATVGVLSRGSIAQT